MVDSLEQYEERYDLDIQKNDKPDCIWQKWGNNKSQRCQNLCAYDQLKECGFNEEPVFDDYGWLSNQRNIKPSEIILLWVEGEIKNTVECRELPNGKWISGAHYILSTSGYVGGLSIWSSQYETRIEALSARLNSILSRVKKSSSAKDRKHIKDIVRVQNKIQQLTLFQ